MELPKEKRQAVISHAVTRRLPPLKPSHIEREQANAIIEALDAHNAISTKALNSETVKRGIKDILLNHAKLWETLRERAVGRPPHEHRQHRRRICQSRKRCAP
jgi:hypothetical protein